MHALNELILWFNALMKSNPVIAGAVGLYGLGVLTFLLRNVPAHIWQFAKTQMTTTLTFDSSQVGTNLQTYNSFMEWYLKQKKWLKWSRSIALTGVQNSWWAGQDTRVGIGDGYHFFMFRGRPCWMQRKQLDRVGAAVTVFQISIIMLGRNHDLIMDLVEQFKYKPDVEKVGIYTYADKAWGRIADIHPRSLDTVIINKELKAKLIKNIASFKKDETWYRDRGLPYKQTFLFHGVPGTGKTSLIKALAAHFGLNICLLRLTSVTDALLEKALASAPADSMIVIEDFDSASATSARKEGDANVTEIMGEMTGLTLSGILNAFDGIVALDGKLIFLTTNVLSELDPALVRSGRVDHCYEIELLKDAEIREYTKLMFPSAQLPKEKLGHISGADLQKLYFEHRDNEAAFIESLPRSGPESNFIEQIATGYGDFTNLKQTVHAG